MTADPNPSSRLYHSDRQPSPNHTLNTGSVGGCEVVAAETEAVVAAPVCLC
jgi:hypothetical protein